MLLLTSSNDTWVSFLFAVEVSGMLLKAPEGLVCQWTFTRAQFTHAKSEAPRTSFLEHDVVTGKTRQRHVVSGQCQNSVICFCKVLGELALLASNHQREAGE